MFGDPLADLIRQQVKEEAQIHLKGEDELNAIWDALILALEAWKQEYGNRKPIDGSTIGGLLGGNPKRIPFAKAKPWQCTGYPFETVTSLTLRLLHENFSEVAKVSKGATETKLMAALLVKGGDGPLSDWFNAYRRMLWAQIPEARKAGAYGALLEHWDKIKAGEKQKVNLAKGRPEGVKARQATAAKKREVIDAAIAALFDKPEKPGWVWSNPEIVSFLVRNLGYPEGTILPAVKQEAARYRKVRKEEQARQYLGR